MALILAIPSVAPSVASAQSESAQEETDTQSCQFLLKEAVSKTKVNWGTLRRGDNDVTAQIMRELGRSGRNRFAPSSSISPKSFPASDSSYFAKVGNEAILLFGLGDCLVGVAFVLPSGIFSVSPAQHGLPLATVSPKVTVMKRIIASLVIMGIFFSTHAFARGSSGIEYLDTERELHGTEFTDRVMYWQKNVAVWTALSVLANDPTLSDWEMHWPPIKSWPGELRPYAAPIANRIITIRSASTKTEHVFNMTCLRDSIRMPPEYNYLAPRSQQMFVIAAAVVCAEDNPFNLYEKTND